MENKARGKDAITGNYVYGYYYPSKGHSIIRDEKDNECIVLPESVSMFIGKADKNGIAIYFGDKVKFGCRVADSEIYSYYEGDYKSRDGVMCQDGFTGIVDWDKKLFEVRIVSIRHEKAMSDADFVLAHHKSQIDWMTRISSRKITLCDHFEIMN